MASGTDTGAIVVYCTVPNQETGREGHRPLYVQNSMLLLLLLLLLQLLWQVLTLG